LREKNWLFSIRGGGGALAARSAWLLFVMPIGLNALLDVHMSLQLCVDHTIHLRFSQELPAP